MITHDICEALYALPDGAVEQRRQSICKPLCAAIIGAVLLIVNYTAIPDSSGALGMTLLVAGVTSLLIGAILTIVRLTSDARVPYHRASKRYMRFSERFYQREQLNELQKTVATGKSEAIDAIARGNVSAITLVECYAPDRTIVAYAVYEYNSFDPSLVGEVRVFRNKV